MNSFDIVISLINNTINRIFSIDFSGVNYIFAIAWFFAIGFFIRGIRK